MALLWRWGRLAAVVAGMVLAGTPGAQGQPPAHQTCLILSAASGLALQVENADDGNLANIELGAVNGGAGQCWRFRPEPFEDAWAIVSLKSGRVVDVMGYSRKSGANVQQFRDFGSRNQRWRIVPAEDGTCRLVAVHSGKCLSAAGGKIGDNVLQADCDGGKGQRWRIEPYPHSDTLYRIVSQKSGKALDVDSQSKADGANIQQFHLNGKPNQLWTLHPDGSAGGVPIYSIISFHSGKAVDVQGSRTEDGANVQQHAYNGGDNQRWKFVPAGRGAYTILSMNSGECLDVKAGSREDGANIQQARCNGGENQVWELLPQPLPLEGPPNSG